MNKENQNDLGTILFLRDNEEDILFPFTKIGEKFRGGAFWCIPNQGNPTSPSALQNGVYRTIHGIDKELEGPWGKISVHVSWEAKESFVTTTASIAALSDSRLRPGLHPYFPVGDNFEIHLGEKKIVKDDIPSDEPVYFETNTKEAVLMTNGKMIRISFEANVGAASYFCLWTDNKDRYLCIEPVLGEALEGNIPAPLLLPLGETLTITSTITYR